MKPSSWKQVFNAELTKWSMSEALKTALLCGYMFASWNGRIYRLADERRLTESRWTDTGMLASELADFTPEQHKAFEGIVAWIHRVQSSWYDFGDDPKTAEAVAIARRVGYGRVLQMVANAWMKIDPTGAITTGTCASFVEDWKKAFPKNSS